MVGDVGHLLHPDRTTVIIMPPVHLLRVIISIKQRRFNNYKKVIFIYIIIAIKLAIYFSYV